MSTSQYVSNLDPEILNRDLDNWQQQQLEQCVNSVARAVGAQIYKKSNDELEQLSPEDRLHDAMSNVTNLMLHKLDELKKQGINQEKIREFLLAPIANMESPYQPGSGMNERFDQLKEKMFNEMDSHIIGHLAVTNRNASSYAGPK